MATATLASRPQPVYAGPWVPRPPEVETRVCLKCKRAYPLDGFPALAIGYRSVACTSCFFGTYVVPPNPQPAIRLREALARRRQQGFGWSDSVFDALIPTALRGLRSRDCEGWPAVFHAHRTAWRAAYERTEAITITTLTVDLIYD